MPEIPGLQPAVRAWLLDGPLAAFVPAYVTRLQQGRYASGTVSRRLGALAHFAHWMALCRLPASRLDESRIDQFLRDDLPHCGSPAHVMGHPRDAHAALMPLLTLLRRQGVIVADLPTPAGPIADELRRYDAHMRDARGLAKGTRTSRLRIIERLLLHQFAGRSLAFDELRPDDIRRFVADQMELVNTTSNAAAINAALRACLRWRATRGDAVRSLLAVMESSP